MIKTCKAKGITLGGRSYGALKQTTVVTMAGYYKKAIYENKGKVQDMKKAILATLHHAVSTDENPRHQFCPSGDKSWCFYRRAKANNQSVGSHKTNVRSPIKPEFYSYLLPIYERLSEDSLLQRCSDCLTQNSNESLHHIIWSKCPKEKFVSKGRVEIAARLAISEYNHGITETVRNIVRELGLLESKKSLEITVKRDTKKMQQNDIMSTLDFKKNRKRKALTEINEETVLKKKEGPSYKAGAF